MATLMRESAYIQQRGAWSVEAALALADSFSAECRASEEIPGWALALRALAGRVRLHQQAQCQGE